MRVVFLVPDLDNGPIARMRDRLMHSKARRFMPTPPMSVGATFGGTLNIMRHCAVVKSLERDLGIQAVLATESGSDTYTDKWGIRGQTYIAWGDLRKDDIALIPDLYVPLIDKLSNVTIAYLQAPTQLHRPFEYKRPNVHLWTDSPFMVEKVRLAYPGKEPVIVPNVVDSAMFPFIEQEKRTPGSLFVFPRKGPEFIDATVKAYAAMGGTYWKPEWVDGVTIHELAQKMREPQAFLASADSEGCALPPQECMAGGIVVIGKHAQGANFCMVHGETSLIATTPEEAAKCLRQAEDAALRKRLAENGHKAIARFFPENEPAQVWREFLATHAKEVRRSA